MDGLAMVKILRKMAVHYLGLSRKEELVNLTRPNLKYRQAKLVEIVPAEVKVESMVGIEDELPELEFYTKIRKPGDFTVHTEIVKASTAFEITEKGRKPIAQLF